MKFFSTLVVLLVAVPLVELYVLIVVGGHLGALTTVALVVATACLGAVLLRMQGLNTVQRIQASLERRQLPAIELLEAAMLLFAGALLLTPGFVTDVVGFAALVPRWRAALANLIAVRMVAGAVIQRPVIDVDFHRDP